MSIAQFWYRQAYKDCFSKALPKVKKMGLVRRISDFSLKTAYWLLSETDKYEGKTLTEWFPDLVPANICKKHAHLSTLSGQLLYVFHVEMARDLGFPVGQAT